MLQRIQTIWLFLASLSAFLSMRFSYYSGTNKEGVASYKLNGTESIVLIIVTTTIAVLALITIFLYKNRKLQLRLCVLGIILEALVLYLYYQQVKTFSVGTYSLTALLQSCIILFFFLAAAGINKDEKIIKESNRLR